MMPDGLGRDEAGIFSWWSSKKPLCERVGTYSPELYKSTGMYAPLNVLYTAWAAAKLFQPSWVLSNPGNILRICAGGFLAVVAQQVALL